MNKPINCMVDGERVTFNHFVELYEEGYDMGSLEVFTYYFDTESNCLIDADGEPFFDMYRYMDVYTYDFHKKIGGTLYIQEHGVVYEFVFPIPGEEDDEW